MSNNRMSRSTVMDQPIRDSGPYEAMVINHLDPFNMGTLEVELLKHSSASGIPERTGQLVPVRYLSPFYGVTPVGGVQPNDGYQFTQKSYGFWAVPPDPGTRVLVIFAEGHAAYGYWIGCIQDQNMNFMVPDGRASTTLTTAGTPDNLRGTKLPVGEFNKSVEQGEKIDPTLFDKPYNKDFTEILEVQGLLKDEIRGTTTTSARREAPSMVFGISTPGPLDKRVGHLTTSYGPDGSQIQIPFNRLGGSSFVMDDGDDKFIRATHAEEGPPIYINKENQEEGGDETIPQNELIRLRTRTGHQILLHNSEDLIYISNSRGTAWIELTSDGKIDIHAQDSISVMSDTDINFTAERDFNVEAGRNINMKASARWSDHNTTEEGVESGRIQIESKFNTNIDVGNDLKLTVTGDYDLTVLQDFRTTVSSNYHLKIDGNIIQRSKGSTSESSGLSWYRTSDSNINDFATGSILETASSGDIMSRAGTSIFHSAASNIENVAGSGYYNKSGGDFDVTSGGTVYLDGSPDVRLNQGHSSPAGNAATAPRATEPVAANLVTLLSTYTLPYIIPGVDQPITYESIITRAPQHEPWPLHENMNPLGVKRDQTDRENPGPLVTADRILTPDTFTKNRGGLQSSVRISGSGGQISSGSDRYEDADVNSEVSAPMNVTATSPGIYGDGLRGPGPSAEVTAARPSNTAGINYGTLKPNVKSRNIKTPRRNPRQNIIDAISLAATQVLPPGYFLAITPKGGWDNPQQRTEYSYNHGMGYAADFHIYPPGASIPDGRLDFTQHAEIYKKLIERLLINANNRGVVPGIAGYSSPGYFLHYDETPSRTPNPGVVRRGDCITWNKGTAGRITKEAISNVRRGLSS